MPKKTTSNTSTIVAEATKSEASSSNTATAARPVNFETSLTELESMIEKMETGQLSLEEGLKTFEEGISIARVCQKALKEAEQKVQILVEQNGVLQTEEFAVEE